MSIKIKGFAHLFGHSAKTSEDDEDEKEKSKKAKGRRAEEDENDDQDDKDSKEKSKNSKRAEEEDGSDDEDDEDKEKSKKAKVRRAEDDDDNADADEGDDDDGDDEDDDRDVKKGRRAERNRISRILGSKYAAGKGPLAVSLAITTGMSSAAAIRVLASSGPMQAPQQSRRLSLDERMSKVENHQLGNDDAGPSGNANSVVSRATALYNQAKGKK
ncbi:DNA primase [Budviciaceae bacterium CWB-B4]|uniref:DNA primase n=1 Tax=Limnobaculum xujianqingii TaxID=2738837 RepID=A0A9D7FWE1_9GAMM|nr:DNA primase [Limnobaculum xujianqingii]MBK5075097.1 DNA primase [Limnobaculum xujianqingii]MBK5178368.1 DNA primase [Limnobaculum xujianqingii]